LPTSSNCTNSLFVNSANTISSYSINCLELNQLISYTTDYSFSKKAIPSITGFQVILTHFSVTVKAIIARIFLTPFSTFLIPLFPSITAFTAIITSITPVISFILQAFISLISISLLILPPFSIPQHSKSCCSPSKAVKFIKVNMLKTSLLS
jgi:hypothetical protein